MAWQPGCSTLHSSPLRASCKTCESGKEPTGDQLACVIIGEQASVYGGERSSGMCTDDGGSIIGTIEECEKGAKLKKTASVSICSATFFLCAILLLSATVAPVLVTRPQHDMRYPIAHCRSWFGTNSHVYCCGSKKSTIVSCKLINFLKWIKNGL